MKCINCGKEFDSKKTTSILERFRRRVFRNMKVSYEDRTATYPGDAFTCSLRCRKAIARLS